VVQFYPALVIWQLDYLKQRRTPISRP